MTEAPAPTLRELWALFKQARGFLIGGALIGLLLALSLIATAIPATRSTMLLAPAELLSDGNKSPSSDKNMAILRLLANAAGTSSSANFEYFISTYAGAQTAQELLKDPQIIAGLQKDQRFIFLPTRQNWTAARLSAYIKEHVKISALGGTPIKKLDYFHPAPDFSVYFLTRLHKITDRHIRQQKQKTAQERSAYLKAQLDQTQQSDHRKVLSELLLEQERLLMLSAINQPFAASMIEPPNAYYKAQWPLRSIMILCLMLAGLFSGALIFALKRAL